MDVYYYFFFLYSTFAVFVFNIIVVKLRFIQLILCSSSTEHCDDLRKKNDMQVGQISFAFIVYQIVQAIMWFNFP
jgi:hypothetical protein